LKFYTLALVKYDGWVRKLVIYFHGQGKGSKRRDH